jgi:hypothetical protein
LAVVLARGPVGVAVGVPPLEAPVGDGVELLVGVDGELSGTEGLCLGGLPPCPELPTGGMVLGSDGVDDGGDVVGVVGTPVRDGGCGGRGRFDGGDTDPGIGGVAVVVGTEGVVEGVVVDGELGVVVDGVLGVGQGRLTRPGWSYQR